MTLRTGLGLLTGMVLLLSAAAHATLGWPAMRGALDATGAPEDLVGALAAGWYFGSVAMAVFGAIALLATLRSARAEDPAPGIVFAIATGYLSFGTVAFIVRGLNPHFLLFVATGLLLAAFAYLSRR